MELPRDWKLLTEREILGKLYERVVALEEEIYYMQNAEELKPLKELEKRFDRVY
jgi:hypothetical protein